MQNQQYGVSVNYSDMSFEEISYVTRVFAQLDEFSKTTGKCQIIPVVKKPVEQIATIANKEDTLLWSPRSIPDPDEEFEEKEKPEETYISKSDVIVNALAKSKDWLPLSEVRELVPEIKYNTLGAILHQLAESGRIAKDVRPTGKTHGRMQRIYYRAR